MRATCILFWMVNLEPFHWMNITEAKVSLWINFWKHPNLHVGLFSSVFCVIEYISNKIIVTKKNWVSWKLFSKSFLETTDLQQWIRICVSLPLLLSFTWFYNEVSNWVFFCCLIFWIWLNDTQFLFTFHHNFYFAHRCIVFNGAEAYVRCIPFRIFIK